jgi:hypothetical protein
MSDKAYLVRFQHPELSIQSVIAASAEIHGEHIALLDSKGELAACSRRRSSKAGPSLRSLSGSGPG